MVLMVGKRWQLHWGTCARHSDPWRLTLPILYVFGRSNFGRCHVALTIRRCLASLYVGCSDADLKGASSSTGTSTSAGKAVAVAVEAAAAVLALALALASTLVIGIGIAIGSGCDRGCSQGHDNGTLFHDLLISQTLRVRSGCVEQIPSSIHTSHTTTR